MIDLVMCPEDDVVSWFDPDPEFALDEELTFVGGTTSCPKISRWFSINVKENTPKLDALQLQASL